MHPDDCLRGLELDHLDQQIKRCDSVVKTFPQHPAPLNDRYLLRTLANDDAGACRDIATALQLSNRRPASPSDRDLREEIRIRHGICNRPAQAVMADPPANAPASPAP